MDMFFFSEDISSFDLKIVRCRHIIEQIKVCDYSRSRSFLYLCLRTSTYQNSNLFVSVITGPFLARLNESVLFLQVTRTFITSQTSLLPLKNPLRLIMGEMFWPL